MNHDDNGRDQNLSFDQLKDAARDCLMALAVKALRDQGRAPALAVLDAIAAGRAHLTFAVELTAEHALIVGQVSQAGELQPLLVAEASGLGSSLPMH